MSLHFRWNRLRERSANGGNGRRRLLDGLRFCLPVELRFSLEIADGRAQVHHDAVRHLVDDERPHNAAVGAGDTSHLARPKRQRVEYVFKGFQRKEFCCAVGIEGNDRNAVISLNPTRFGDSGHPCVFDGKTPR